jgi:hypothetical protein
MSKYVRLRPFNRKRGFVLRRYLYQSQKFVDGKWYEVPDTMGDYLSTVTSVPGDDDSPLAFDVFDSKDEALALVAREAEAKQKATVENPEQVGVLTSQDLGEDRLAEDRAKRAQENLDKAKAKRAEEAKREERRSAKASKKDKNRRRGGKSPVDAEPVAPKEPDPYE